MITTDSDDMTDLLAAFDRTYQEGTPCDGPWLFAHEIDGDDVLLRVTADDAILFEVALTVDDEERVRDTAFDLGLACAARNAGRVLIAEVQRLRADLAEAVAAVQRLDELNRGLDARLCHVDAEYRNARLATRGRERGRDSDGADLG